jgi:ribosomal protein S18 acetylase RimI-like enzyme
VSGPVVSLRPATDADAEFLLSVFASTRAEELAQVPWSEAERDAFLRMQFAAQTTHYTQHYAASSTFEVVLVDGEPAGRLIVHRGPREVRIVDIALLPRFRGRGVGTRLLAPLLEEADAKGLRVSIYVEWNNPALRLYTRLGFVKVGEHGLSLLMDRQPKTAS